MKRFVTKLTSRKGETLAEILVAVLIVVLAAGMFAALYSASMNINMAARAADEQFYDAVGTLENKIGTNEGVGGTLHYVPIEGETEADKHEDTAKEQHVTVQVVTQDGLSVYSGGGN